MGTEPEKNSIQDPNAALTTPLDYETLKRLGLESIIRLGSDHWTDYNEHDPGITIMEVLIFALTDLAYRTDFPIEDILAQQQLTSEELARTQFYTARNILSVNPVTIPDFRKIIIDLEDVQNAWILTGDSDFDPTKGALRIIVDPTVKFWEAFNKLKFQENRDEYLQEEQPAVTAAAFEQNLIDLVSDAFFQHRNLGQDLSGIVLRRPLEIRFWIDLAVQQGVIPEEIVGRILLELESYLANAVRFLSFQAMMDKFDQDINAIYNGPALQHGFLPDDALKDAIKELRTVDLIPLLESIPEVVRIRQLKFQTNADKLGIQEYRLEPPGWVYRQNLPIEYKPILAPVDEQLIVISKGDAVFGWDEAKAKTEWQNLRNKQRVAKLSKAKRDVAIPTGRFRDLTSYLSIQTEFPRIYGLQPHGLPPKADAARKGQVKQLKAFLLIFDQIMANYLAQLAHCGELFSWSTEIKRTYFFQGLQDAVSDISLLLNNFPLEPDPDTSHKYRAEPQEMKQALQNYLVNLGKLREDPATFESRRNGFLTHLLSRFGRTLEMYTGSFGALEGNAQSALETEQRVAIDTKQRILENYVPLSAGRGRGFFLQAKTENFSGEFSGLRQWVETLFDMPPETLDVFHFNERFWLGNYNTALPSDNPVAEFTIVSEDGRPVDARELMRIGTVKSNYQVSTEDAEATGEITPRFSLLLFDIPKDESQESRIYKVKQWFTDLEELMASRTRLVQLFSRFNRTSERIYVVEHFLLRPLPQERFFGLSIMDALGKAWLTTVNWHTRHDLEQLQEMTGQEYAYFRIFTAAPETETGFYPDETWQDFVQNIDHETGETSIESHPGPMARFSFGVVRSHTGNFGIELLYGSFSRLVGCKIVSGRAYDTAEDAVSAIRSWLAALAKFRFSVRTRDTGLYALAMEYGPAEDPISFTLNKHFHSEREIETHLLKWQKSIFPVSFSVLGDNSTGYRVRLTHQSAGMVFHFQSDNSFQYYPEAERVIENYRSVLKKEVSRPDKSLNLWKAFLRPWPWNSPELKHNTPPMISRDPYSSMLTIVLPNWPVRFQQEGFREALLKVIESESPAHLWLNTIWLDMPTFHRFRFLYGNWWDAYRNQEAGLPYFRRRLLNFLMTQSFTDHQSSPNE